MKRIFGVHLAAIAMVAALGLSACDDDDGPTNTGNDTTAPTVSSVTGVDSTHFNIRFSEMLDRESAQTEANYTVETTAAPPVPVTVLNASLLDDRRTVVVTTDGRMADAAYTLTVNGVADLNGNAISTPVERGFTGSGDADVTAPEIVMLTPSRNETNVLPTAPIEISFSEPVPLEDFSTAFQMTGNGGPVSVTVTSTDGVHYTVQPTAPLTDLTMYTVTLTDLQDESGNAMAPEEYTFRTGTASAVTSVR